MCGSTASETCGKHCALRDGTAMTGTVSVTKSVSVTSTCMVTVACGSTVTGKTCVNA